MKKLNKIIIFVSLVIAICAMTLGFAFFSSTLTISSSAIVTPNPDDFKITIYGTKNKGVYQTLTFTSSDISDVLCYPYEENATSSVASIDNVTHTISNIKASFDNGLGTTYYAFLIVNEGKYDAYLDLSNMSFYNGQYILSSMLNYECIAGEGTSENLVEEACNGIIGKANFIDINSSISAGSFVIKKTTDSFYKIPAGGEEVISFYLEYEGPFADGPFDVKFDDFQLNFSTTG